MLSRLFFPETAGKNQYVFFSIALTILTLADSTMGYTAPLLIEKLSGGHDTLMGLILATSSMAGIVIDFSFARMFPKKNSWFFLRILFLFMFFFPLPFLLFHSVAAAIIGMVAWGIYFEAMVFANFHAIHEEVRASEHAWAWGINGILRTLGWVIGPFLASLLYGISEDLPLRVAVFCYALSLTGFGLLALSAKKGREQEKTSGEYVLAHRTFGREFEIWETYGKVLWPLLLFTVLYFLIESAFFSIGPLFGEHLKTIHPLGGIFVSLYSIPGLFVGFLLTQLSAPFGKKRLAYLGGVIAGISFLLVGFSHSLPLILLCTLIASIGLCIWQPALSAVFQDYVGRAKEFGNDLIGLTAMAGSFAYIVGPIVNGALSERFGEQNVFAIWGGVALLYSALLFFIVKRKVHLPQKQVEMIG